LQGTSEESPEGREKLSPCPEKNTKKLMGKKKKNPNMLQQGGKTADGLLLFGRGEGLGGGGRGKISGGVQQKRREKLRRKGGISNLLSKVQKKRGN